MSTGPHSSGNLSRTGQHTCSRNLYEVDHQKVAEEINDLTGNFWELEALESVCATIQGEMKAVQKAEELSTYKNAYER